jgi:hypothetical protein
MNVDIKHLVTVLPSMNMWSASPSPPESPVQLLRTPPVTPPRMKAD